MAHNHRNGLSMFFLGFQSLRWTPWIALCHLWFCGWSLDDYFDPCDFLNPKMIFAYICHLRPTWFGVPPLGNPLYNPTYVYIYMHITYYIILWYIFWTVNFPVFFILFRHKWWESHCPIPYSWRMPQAGHYQGQCSCSSAGCFFSGSINMFPAEHLIIINDQYNIFMWLTLMINDDFVGTQLCSVWCVCQQQRFMGYGCKRLGIKTSAVHPSHFKHII